MSLADDEAQFWTHDMAKQEWGKDKVTVVVTYLSEQSAQYVYGKI